MKEIDNIESILKRGSDVPIGFILHVVVSQLLVIALILFWLFRSNAQYGYITNEEACLIILIPLIIQLAWFAGHYRISKKDWADFKELYNSVTTEEHVYVGQLPSGLTAYVKASVTYIILCTILNVHLTAWMAYEQAKLLDNAVTHTQWVLTSAFIILNCTGFAFLVGDSLEKAKVLMISQELKYSIRDYSDRA